MNQRKLEQQMLVALLSLLDFGFRNVVLRSDAIVLKFRYVSFGDRWKLIVIHFERDVKSSQCQELNS